MPDIAQSLDSSERRRRALSRWDNEGGALSSKSETVADVPGMTNAELVHLRVRVIALENLMIAVLADGSERQLEIAREMALQISPRPGFTQHPLTVQAAHHMTDFVDRAIHFRKIEPQ